MKEKHCDLFPNIKGILNRKEPQDYTKNAWNIIAKVRCISPKVEENKTSYSVQEWKIKGKINCLLKYKKVNHFWDFSYSKYSITVPKIKNQEVY